MKNKQFSVIFFDKTFVCIEFLIQMMFQFRNVIKNYLNLQFNAIWVFMEKPKSM